MRCNKKQLCLNIPGTTTSIYRGASLYLYVIENVVIILLLSSLNIHYIESNPTANIENVIQRNFETYLVSPQLAVSLHHKPHCNSEMQDKRRLFKQRNKSGQPGTASSRDK